MRETHNFKINVLDISEAKVIDLVKLFEDCDVVVHLAAWPGVRQGQLMPNLYTKNNVTAFSSILEAVREIKPNHFMYASSSSIYGDLAKNGPVRETDASGLNLKSYYAATKWMNETEARASQELVEFPITALRFFTVSGPWGRPDMSLFKFTQAILAGEKISIFNYGKHRRDFTYVDDIVEGVLRMLDRPASPNPNWSGDCPDPGSSLAPWRVYNIGNNSPVKLMDLVAALERALNMRADVDMLPLQPGDVPDTYANIDALVEQFQYKPETSIEQGVANFVSWYRKYFKV